MTESVFWFFLELNSLCISLVSAHEDVGDEPYHSVEKTEMKSSSFLVSAAGFALGAFYGPVAQAQSSDPPKDIWVTGYYAGWMQAWENYGLLPAEEIDYSALTHIIHFGLVPRSNGAIDSLANSMTEVNSRELVSRAHAAGIKALICIGGWGTDAGFRVATSPLNLHSFIDKLVGFMQRRGYDGIDIDWEYLNGSDAIQYSLFIKALRAKLDAISPRPLLTAAAAWQPSILAPLAAEFDQINIMTYDLSGAWPGWVAWHNSPIYDGGFVFPSTLRPVPSTDGMVGNFKIAGIPSHKLGIGIDFYGYVWSGGAGTPAGGVTEPRQSWLFPPFVRPNVPFYRIYEDYYRAEFYRWDSLAQAPYLSIDEAGSENDRFVSFCDEISSEKKIAYARDNGLGGVFIWELGGGYLSEGHSHRDRLLQAVKNASRGITLPPQAPLLLHPSNGAGNVPLKTELRWEDASGSLTYLIQVSRDSLFNNLVAEDSTLTEAVFRPELEHSAAYFWRVAARNSAGWSPYSPAWTFETARISDAPGNPIPTTYSLSQNYPNPFNAKTWIHFDLPEPRHVVLEVYSIQGQLVSTLIDGELNEGTHRVSWSPVAVPSGVYFYRIRTWSRGYSPELFYPPEESFQQTRRLLYVK